jgi:hypothetical protein
VHSILECGGSSPLSARALVRGDVRERNVAAHHGAPHQQARSTITLLRWLLEAPSTENWVEALPAEAVSCMLPVERKTKIEILAPVVDRRHITTVDRGELNRRSLLKTGDATRVSAAWAGMAEEWAKAVGIAPEIPLADLGAHRLGPGMRLRPFGPKAHPPASRFGGQGKCHPIVPVGFS